MRGRPIKWRGKAFVTNMECPCCGYEATVEFQGDRILGIKHWTFDLDLQCPYVDSKKATPGARFQRLVFDYADLEDRLLSAKEAIRKQEHMERRLDGRKQHNTGGNDPAYDSASLEEVL